MRAAGCFRAARFPHHAVGTSHLQHGTRARRSYTTTTGNLWRDDGERAIERPRQLPDRGLQRVGKAVAPGARVAKDGHVLGVLDSPQFLRRVGGRM